MFAINLITQPDTFMVETLTYLEVLLFFFVYNQKTKKNSLEQIN